MRLNYLYDMRLAFDQNKTQLKKEQDPNRPELEGEPVSGDPTTGLPPMPDRSGVQDTPLKPRHKRFFNAYTNQPATDKVGYPDQAWSNVKELSPASKKVRPYNLNWQH
jgi:hypothetical protein